MDLAWDDHSIRCAKQAMLFKNRMIRCGKLSKNVNSKSTLDAKAKRPAPDAKPTSVAKKRRVDQGAHVEQELRASCKGMY